MPDRLPRVGSLSTPFQDYEAIPIIDEGGGAPPDIESAPLESLARKILALVETQDQREARQRRFRRASLEGFGQVEPVASAMLQQPGSPKPVEEVGNVGLGQL